MDNNKFYDNLGPEETKKTLKALDDVLTGIQSRKTDLKEQHYESFLILKEQEDAIEFTKSRQENIVKRMNEAKDEERDLNIIIKKLQKTLKEEELK